ncbi:unnamed protein product [Cuscuta campestris]|uniref:Uncharacterized protein n=1 Tax=Cuscuta campestris TaxID=132261 RepID=A0A484N5E2_9ASTE|nr:unnamed protein product [Cuscuta campestris]
MIGYKHVMHQWAVNMIEIVFHISILCYTIGSSSVSPSGRRHNRPASLVLLCPLATVERIELVTPECSMPLTSVLLILICLHCILEFPQMTRQPGPSFHVDVFWSAHELGSSGELGSAHVLG